MTTGQVQRYKLTGNETISVDKMGGQSVLHIGQYQFELPQGQSLTKFASQWNQVSTQLQSFSGVGTGSIPNQK